MSLGFLKVTKSFLSTITCFLQGPLGCFYLVDGGCSAIDAAMTVNYIAKPFFISGACCNLGAGTCMLGALATGTICPPATLALGSAGTSLRRIGLYAVKVANSLEGKPTLTKTTSVVADVVEFLN